jgi:hypothetical protein
VRPARPRLVTGPAPIPCFSAKFTRGLVGTPRCVHSAFRCPACMVWAGLAMPGLTARWIAAGYRMQVMLSRGPWAGFSTTGTMVMDVLDARS